VARRTAWSRRWLFAGLALTSSAVLFACQLEIVTGPGSPPPGPSPAPAPPSATASAPLPTPAPDATLVYDLATAVLDVRDAETGKPVAGAEVSVDSDAARITAADGTTTLPLPWGAARRVRVRHPAYLVGRDLLSQVGYTRRIVFLTPRRADNFATVLTTGGEQTVRLGGATITVPAGAIPAGTRIDFGMAHTRSLVRPEGAFFPGARAPIALQQLQVDVAGADPYRFQRLVDPQRPLRVVLAPSAESVAALSVGGWRVLLSAGAGVEALPEGDVTFDSARGELRFPLRHFSDVTVATDALVEGGCGAEPVTLHFWRMTNRSSQRSEGPFPKIRACQEGASILRIETSLDVSTTVSGSWSTGVRDTERLELAILGGGKGKLLGQGVKVLGGYWRQQNTETTSSASGDFSVVSSSTIQVSREKSCPGGWACRGELWVDTEEDELEIVHYSANLTGLLGADPAYSALVKVPQTSCLTGRTSYSPQRVPDQDKIRRYGEGLALMVQLDEASGSTSGQGDPAIRRTVERNRSAFREEIFQTKTLRFTGSRMETWSIAPRCGRVETGTATRDGGSPEGGGGVPGVPGADGVPQPPYTRLCPDHARSPLSPVPGPLEPDGMIDPPGPVGTPTRFNVDGALVTLELIAGPTATLPTNIEEVAWANACCPTESNQVRFSTQVQLNLGGASTSGAGHLHWNGATWKAEAELGVELPLIGAQAVIAHDGRFAVGTGQQVQTVLRQIASVRRTASATASAAGTLTTCQTQGVYAYFRRTEYGLRITVSRAGKSESRMIPVSASFYSTPYEGPKRTFQEHCARDFTHLGNPGTTVRPRGDAGLFFDAGARSDGGAIPDGGSSAANLGCPPGPGCEVCCETRASSGAAFQACRATCQ
jgi:hypothetical protein